LTSVSPPKQPAHRQEALPMASTKDASPSKFYVLGVTALVAAGATVFYFHFARNQELSTVREAKALVAERGPRIEIVTTTAGPTLRSIKLLGDVRSGATATLYAKVAGYLKVIHVDKGDKVEAGQLIAEIESPEIEQQYAAASADLVNKRRNLARLKELYAKGNTTQVALYQAETDATVAENNVGVLATSIAYKTVKAPFAGRITARFADPGALVSNAQTNFMSAMPMVTISDDTRIRVYGYLQQADVPFVSIGDPAEVSDASNPDRKRMATVTRMTGELDAKTRTMLVEIHLDNQDNFFIPGSFAYVTLQVKVQSYPQIPVTALLTRANENVVAVLDKDVVHFRPVKIASTDGAILSLADGLKPGEKIAINVPDEVTNGSRIQPIEATATARAR
jgi:RND family efflux transporter MFP subunit